MDVATTRSKWFRINTELQEHIERYTAEMKLESFLFKSRRGNQPIQRVQAYKILKEAAKKAGNADIGTHTHRKTFGYHFY